jgi:hypothetical protein
MSANDAQRIESIYNISDFEFFEIGEFTTEAQSRRGEYFTTENTKYLRYFGFRFQNNLNDGTM